jgi:nucleotide-binding universal stress UspA family protein
MKKILVPCNFSKHAQQAYKFAMDLASTNGGEVFVLKVIDMPVAYESTFGFQPYAFDSSLLIDLEADARKNYEKMKGLYADITVPVSFHIGHGPVTATIRNFINGNEIDLVVMGTHGAGGIGDFFFGSNTDKIVRFSPVPVFAIRKSLEIASIKNIVFANALHLDQTELIEKLKRLQNLFKATLHILYVNTPSHFKEGTDIKRELEDFAKYFNLENFTLNIRDNIDEGDGIIKFAHEINGDMIAMETHGRRGLSHLFHGSIAEDVVNQVDSPIWTFVAGRK